MATNNNNKQFERELTGRESAVSFMGIIAIFLLMSMDENADWGTTEWVRVAIAFVVAIATIIYQAKCMHTPLEESKDGE